MYTASSYKSHFNFRYSYILLRIKLMV